MLQLKSTLFIWIIVGALQATLGLKFHDDSIPELESPCLPGTPCIPPGKAFQPPKTQAHSSKPPAKFTLKKSSSKDPCINNFLCTFQEEVAASKILTDFFDYFEDLPAMEFCNGKYPEILDILTQIKTPNVEFVAYEAIEPVAENFEKLSSDIVIQVYANSAAKYLYTQGVLTPQNSEKLAKQFAKMMEEAADCDDSPYVALNEGFVSFLDSFGLFTPDKALLIALQYANEWKLAAKPKRG